MRRRTLALIAQMNLAEYCNMATRQPSAQCPWRASNHGKRHFARFYTKKNRNHLLIQIRSGGIQTCHVTDSSQSDHVAGWGEAWTRQGAGGMHGERNLDRAWMNHVMEMSCSDDVVGSEGIEKSLAVNALTSERKFTK